MCVCMYIDAGCSASGTPKQKGRAGRVCTYPYTPSMYAYVYVCVYVRMLNVCMYVYRRGLLSERNA